MIAKVKLYSKLDTLEAELKALLIPHLERAAEGNNDLVFCARDFNPPKELKGLTDKKTEKLVAMGTQILALKEKLGEPSEGTIAQRICWYCRTWSSADNRHRKNAQSLAKKFLIEIDKAGKR
ncbi:MAG: hypothetical protein KUG79_18240 [Pseudomonadales bacterium]|nr:hypothetical protein [Pseudomonadales bacterium]